MIAPPAAPQGPVLRDIHLPDTPGWWPPAPGWWLLGMLALALLAGAAWWWRARRRTRHRDARVLAELEAIVAAGSGQPDALAAQLHQLLRRAARRIDPAATHAQGEAWRRLLATVPVAPATVDRLMELEAAMYRRQPWDREAVVEAVRGWLVAALRWRPKAPRHA